MIYRVTLTPSQLKFTHCTNVGREDIVRNDRVFGDKYFSGLDMEWAGHILLTDTCQLSSQWFYDSNSPDELINHIETHDLPKHRIIVYAVDDEENEEPVIIEKY